MSKRKQLAILAKFIGLTAAHKILILLTNKLESIEKLQTEADHYDDLSIELAQGNWNNQDVEQIRELAEKQCLKKIDSYKDVDNKKYGMIEQTINDIISDLELE